MASSTVGTAVIKLSFDGSDVKAELSKTSSQFKDAGEKAGSQFGSAVTIAMGSLISKGVSKVIGSITSNLDSAINRVDVINNFPKVMESLGFSADDAAISIKTISDRLDGLPSTLNGVVSDVQKLTATMGNLNSGMVNATSLGLALNDMFLAGGKGTEVASNAMEQYNQMLAQGKPDMQSWRSMLNAAPGQLKQLAKTLIGATANQNDLYQALMDGVITFDQMNEAIVKLDREGGEGFDSFERQARSATGGVGTALQNVQNRIGKAIATVIDTIGGENIAAAINGFSSHFKDIGVAVGNFVKDAMSQIGNFTRFVSQNLWITDIIKGAIASIVAIGIGNKIMQLKSKVQTLFAAISAHPLMALITAIVGVATAISSAITRESKLTEALRTTREASEKAKDEYNRLADARKAALSESMSELSYYDELYSDLRNITDENGNVRAGYEARAKFIVDKLQEALGIEIKMNNGVIESYGDVIDAVEKTIRVKYAEIQLKSEEEAYAEAIKKRGDSMQRIVDLRKQITEAIQHGSFQEVQEAIKAEQALNGELETYKRYSWDIQRYTDDYTAFVENRYEDMSDAVWDYSDALYQSDVQNQIQLEQSVRNSEAKLKEAEDLYRETGMQIYKDTADSYRKLVDDTKGKLDSYTTVTATSMQAVHDGFCGKLNQTVVDATKIAGNFSGVGQKGGNALASGFNSQSGNMFNAGVGLINSTANGANKASSNAIKVIQNTANSMVSVLGNSYGQFYSVGVNSIYGMSNGWMGRAYEVASKMVNSVMDQVKWMMGIHSPSTVFRDQVGVMLARGLGIGFVNEMGSVSDDMVGAIPMSFGMPAYATAWSSGIEGAIMEQSGSVVSTSNNINVYMNNTIDNDMSIDEVGRKFSQSIRRYA